MRNSKPVFDAGTCDWGCGEGRGAGLRGNYFNRNETNGFGSTPAPELLPEDRQVTGTETLGWGCGPAGRGDTRGSGGNSMTGQVQIRWRKCNC